MRIPSPAEAARLLAEAEARNPGPWAAHSQHVAGAARAIAAHWPGMDPDAAYVAGLLHDIGRREGVTKMRHAIGGQRYLSALGYADAGRICLTHSFAIQDIRACAGEWDCTPEELAVAEGDLAAMTYDGYDRLIQLCDALALPSGYCLMEMRLVDVALRHGVNAYTVPRWEAYRGLLREVEGVIGRSVYGLLPGVVENTFGSR